MSVTQNTLIQSHTSFNKSMSDVYAGLRLHGVCATPSALTSALMQTAASRHLHSQQEVSRPLMSASHYINICKNLKMSSYSRSLLCYFGVLKRRKSPRKRFHASLWVDNFYL